MFSSHHAATLLTPAQLEDQEFIFGKFILFILLLEIEVQWFEIDTRFRHILDITTIFPIVDSIKFFMSWAKILMVAEPMNWNFSNLGKLHVHIFSDT